MTTQEKREAIMALLCEDHEDSEWLWLCLFRLRG